MADSTRPSHRSRSTLPPSLAFEAIGTSWQIDTTDPLPDRLEASFKLRIEDFDRTWSRFRDDSLVAEIARTPGVYAFPAEANALFDVYRRLYEVTGGSVSPLVGRALETLGYDRAYSLKPTGTPIPVPAWDDAFAWDGTNLSTVRPVTVDVGAAGKGYLVDIVGELLVEHGMRGIVIDASGDIRRWDTGTIRVALEHPGDPTKAIGVINLGNGAICASASNRRAWGNGLHHMIDATTGLPTGGVIATWAIAPTALIADGAATALFFGDAEEVAEEFGIQYVRMFSTGRVEFSPDLDGELFL